MSTLPKQKIIEYLEKGDLILNPSRKEDGQLDVQPASYDLRAGTIIWKELDPNTKEFHTKIKHYNPELSLDKQETESLQPGQVMFVITYEEIKMPNNLCGTVYAKNSFSRDGILAFTTGHIDPGIQCPIVVRLINLRAIPFSIRLGQEIYTIVFHTLEKIDESKLEKHDRISMEKTLANTLNSADSALGNALNDISLTQNFVKKSEFEELKNHCGKLIKHEEFGKVLRQVAFKSVWGILVVLFAILGAIAAVVKIVEFFK